MNIQIYIILINSFILIFIFSFNFHYKSFHPLILITILLILLIISSINLRIYINNHWFSFIIYLIIIGGIIIIFLYFIRFINNIKTSVKWDFLKNLLLKFLFTIIVFLMIINLIKEHNWIINSNEIKSLQIFTVINTFNNLNYLYLYPKRITSILSILYLLISLTIIVKICLTKKLTLRKFNYEKIII